MTPPEPRYQPNPATDGELLPVVDEQDRVLRLASRREIHAGGLLHRAVHVILLDMQGRVLLQKRSATKDAYPGQWDISVGGHVGAGESYLETARREITEEMGFAGIEPEFVAVLEPAPATGWEFIHLFVGRASGDPAPDPGEVAGFRWEQRPLLAPDALLDAERPARVATPSPREQPRMSRQTDPILTVGQVILKSAQWLGAKEVDSPRLDAELLLAYVLHCSRLDLYLQWDKPLMELEVGNYRELIRSRGQDRTPVARLLGKKEFYGRDFEVTAATFVPRPETEGLVDRALELLTADPALRVERPVVLEVGTGTGAIVATLAAENAEPRYIAIDVSPGALATARKNAAALHVDSRIDFRQGSGLSGYDGSLHLLVSNPPYIPSGQIPTLPAEVKDHDPMPALDGGTDGLDCVREIVAQAKPCLVPGAWVLLEIGEEQEEGCLEVFAQAGIFTGARVERDLAGQPRYAMARRKA